MIHPDDALKLLLDLTFCIPEQKVSFKKANGRYLSNSVINLIPSPPFDKSAMDGYAIPDDEQTGNYDVIETIPAGQVPLYPLKSGTCSKIMTGAMIPKNTKRIIRIENTVEKNSVMTVKVPDSLVNIIHVGENRKKGQILMNPLRLSAQNLAILASSGYKRIPVKRKVTAVVINTGGEIINPGKKLKPGCIYNSNGIQLKTQLESAGVHVYRVITVKDKLLTVTVAVRRAMAVADLVIISGGVSEGDFDFVPNACYRAGALQLFHGLMVKPGKPVFAARKNGKIIFGMPGNPVSGFVIFELLVRPLIYHMNGIKYEPLQVSGILESSIKRKNADRVEYRPAFYHDGKITIPDFKGSSDIQSFCAANSLIRMEIGETSLEKGTTQHVRFL